MKTWRRIFRLRDLVIGGLVILAFAIVAIAAPLLAPPRYPDDPYRIPTKGFSMSPSPPGPEHPLGTLPRQYDIYYGLVWGTRVAFRDGLFVALARAIIGLLIGLASGFAGGIIDSLLMRITDAFMAFPIIAAILLMLAFFGGGYISRAVGEDEGLVMISLVIFGWMPYARLVRGNVLAERRKEYVEAATSTGSTWERMLFRHLLPNSLSGLFIVLASDIGGVVVLMAVFSFLGFTGQQMSADWGKLLSASRDWIVSVRTAPFATWYVYMPTSMAVVLYSAGWNLMGEGLRELLDPKTR